MKARSLLPTLLACAVRSVAGGMAPMDELHTYAAFVAHSPLVLLAMPRRELLLYDAGAGRVRGWIPQDGAITAVRASPDGRAMAVGVHAGFAPVSGYLAAWTLPGGRYVGAISTPGAHALDFAGDELAVAMFGYVHLWPYTRLSGETLTFPGAAAIVGGEAAVTALKAYGGRILLAFSDGTCRLVSRQGDAIASIQASDKDVADAALSPDGTTIATGAGDGRLVLWKLGGAPLQAWSEQFAGTVTAVAFDPGGRLVACATDDGELGLFGSDDGRRLWKRRSNTLHKDGLDMTGYASITFTPDSRSVVAATVDNEIQLHPVDGGTVMPLLPRDFVTAAAYSPDGSSVAVGTYHGRLLIRSQDGEREAGRTDDGPIMSLSFERDGRLLTGSLGGSLTEFGGPAMRRLGEIDSLRQATVAGETMLLAGTETLEAPNGAIVAYRGGQRWQANGGHGAFTSVLQRAEVVVTGGLDGRLRAWTPFSAVQPIAVEETGAAINAMLAASADEFFAIDDDGSISRFRWGDGRFTRGAARRVSGTSLKIAAADSRRIAVADFGGGLWVLEAATLRELASRDYPSQVTALAFNGRGVLSVFTADGEEHRVVLKDGPDKS
jgi:WD40 repeat protein